MIRYLALAVACMLVIPGCSHLNRSPLVGPQASPTWPPATGTVLAQTAYGRITSLEPGGFTLELRETPLPPERSEDERATAIAAIRQFVRSPDLPFEYRGLQRHPENTGIVVEVYRTSDTEFMVDIQTNAVMYMQRLGETPLWGNPATLSRKQLEELARVFLSGENACFQDIVEQLQFEPGNKGDNYFFRWQSPHPDAERPWNQPAFVQVSIDVHGAIFGFVDSGICHLSGE